jgi:dipeptidyl aminopeptidase/acylaminoacyl peptidase
LGPDDPVPVVVAAGGTLSDPAVAEDGTVYLLSESISQPPEVVRLGAGGELHRVTRFTEAGLSGIELGKVDDLSFSGADGDPVQMFLVYPPLFDAAGRWPLVQLIHGGPHGIFGDAWHWRWNVHCFAAPGQVVALVNFHGSSSFGQAFTASIEGTWGDQPYRDIEAATDHLIGLGFIDEAHMAVAGGSYGGYLAAYITAQTDRYACAVAHAAVTNLAGMYASDLTEGRRRAFGAEIWEDRAKVERFSPSTHAAGYGTPTLIIHGERDYRVPAKGISARLVYYPEENHWILSPQSSLHWYGEVLGWLNLYLR